MTGDIPLPAEIVLAPSWWHRNAGITFDRDFFFHPARRIGDERKMEKELYERWGRYGLGADRDEDRPEVGPVHLAAGYLLSEMLGCRVEYAEDKPPEVRPAHRESLALDPEEAFASGAFRAFAGLLDRLKAKCGRLTGDVNFGGILNLALDLRGEALFMDLYDRPEEAKQFFSGIFGVIDRFVEGVMSETGTSSVAVNRTVRHVKGPVFLHSECSHTMISTESYEEFLLPYDREWSLRRRPFGIHYCGRDPHRYAASFARLPRLDFLDVGWGGDVKELRKHLPNTFLNIRLSPVEIIGKTTGEIACDIRRLAADSGDPALTGICCINMDETVGDDKIEAILKTVTELREELRGSPARKNGPSRRRKGEVE